MATNPKTFDPKVFELAALFLSDEPDLNTEAARISLAIEIQQCVENEIEFMKSMMEKAS
jgi:hypothetical protein